MDIKTWLGISIIIIPIIYMIITWIINSDGEVNLAITFVGIFSALIGAYLVIEASEQKQDSEKEILSENKRSSKV